MNPDPVTLARLAEAIQGGQMKPWDVPMGDPNTPPPPPISPQPPAMMTPPVTPTMPAPDPVGLSEELQGMRDTINTHPLVLKLKALLSGTPEAEGPDQRPIIR